MTSMPPILYTFRRCPYAIRARMTLTYAGIRFEVREVVLRSKPQEMLTLSPKGTVPVMQLENGMVLEESLDIMRWALKQSDPDAWLPSNAAIQLATENLIEANDNLFKPSLDGFKYPDQYPAKTAIEHREQGMLFLSQLDEQLQASKYLFGAALTLADVAVFPFVRQFSGVDNEWFESTSLNHLKNWLHGLVESSLFQSVMKKYPPWTSTNRPL